MEAPHLKQLDQRYASRGLRVVGITEMDPKPSEIRAFRKRFGLTFPALLDPGEKVGKRYKLEGHPTAVLIDRKGVVRFVHTGFLDGEEKLLEHAVDAVLAGKEPPKEAP